MFARPARPRFLRDERGGAIVETVIILPILLWAFVAMFVYWDAYRAQNTAMKASYTIADMITREIVDVSPTYVTGLKTVYDYLVATDQATSLAVTSVTWSSARNRYEVLWSETRSKAGMQNPLPRLGTTAIANFKNQLPNMADGDTVIVTQSRMNYAPLFEVGVPNFVYDQFIVTRPRGPKITCPTCGVGT
jgi:hypothetical protein